MSIVKLEQVEEKLLTIQGERVLLDSDVAEMYGVATKRINEAVKNNPERFPSGYIIKLSEIEKVELVENFDRFNRLKHSTALPKAFTEKGLYMLATILKSTQAVQTTIAIIETFSKIRHLSRNLKQLLTVKNDSEQKSLMQNSGEIIAEILDDDLETTGTETTIELNFALLKFDGHVKRRFILTAYKY
jgi:hypothetical protein